MQNQAPTNILRSKRMDKEGELLRYFKWFPEESKKLIEVNKIVARNMNASTQYKKIEEQCANLKQLDLSSYATREIDIEFVKKMNGLKSLVISLRNDQKNKYLPILLECLHNLQSLELKNELIDDSDLKMIFNKIHKLSSIKISNSKVTIQSINYLSNFKPNLKALHIRGCKIGAQGCNLIAFNLRELEDLDIDGCGLNNESLIWINNNLLKLKNLNISNNQYQIGTNIYLRNLQQLKKLNQFSLQYLGQTLVKRLVLNLKSLRILSTKSLDLQRLPRNFRRNLKFYSNLEDVIG